MAGDFTVYCTVLATSEPSPVKKVGETMLCDFRAMWSKSKKNKQTNAWENGEPFWIKVKAWGSCAEYIAANLNNKEQVIIQGGTLEVETWEDKTTKEKKVAYVLNVNECVIKPKKDKSGSTKQTPSDPPPATMPGDSNIPF